jgi:hypothetical protein
MRLTPLKKLAGATALGLALMGSPALASDAPTATKLLFASPYLTKVEPDQTLVYTFERNTIDESKYGPGMKDTIRLEVKQDETDKDKRSVYMKIYSGPRERNLGPFIHTTGNPAVMVLLEQDTFELKRRLGGQPAYFRNKIRKAMRDEAKVEETSFDFNGDKIDGHKITIQPFKDDPNMSRVPEFAATIYEFVVSDAVPGGIYRVSSIIPAANDPGTPLKQQDMTFSQKEQK